MGSWEYDFRDNTWRIDEGQYRIFDVDPDTEPTLERVRALVQKDDWNRLIEQLDTVSTESRSFQSELRVVRANGETRWCLAAAAVTFDEDGEKSHVGGVTIDITERKETEEKQSLLAREVDHRARNALAVVQAIVRMSHAPTMEAYAAGVEGRIRALSLSHDLLSKSRWLGADHHRNSFAKRSSPIRPTAQRASNSVDLRSFCPPTMRKRSRSPFTS